jgi:hypothetical protein
MKEPAMHAVRVLRNCLGVALKRMHALRCTTLLDAVRALIAGRRLTLMELARSWPEALRVAAPLKRLDRLLGNPHLAEERDGLYSAIIRWAVRQPRPVIVVDWSPLDHRGRFQLLRAGLAVGGRTLTVYEKPYPAKAVGSPRAERALLRVLRQAIPMGCVPILVTDAGFHAPWFRAVHRFGWDWIGRVRGRALVKPHAAQDTIDRWIPCTQLYRRVREAARDLGLWDTVRRQPIVCRLVLYYKARRGRIDVTLAGRRARNAYSRKIAQRESEPWLLAVSPALALAPAQVVAIYARRMQIEQSFRDLKSHRYGVGFEDSLTRTCDRLAVLLLILALASFVAWITARTATGIAVRRATAMLVRTTQAGVLSWHRLGWQLLREQRWRIGIRVNFAAILLDGDALAEG